MAYAAKEHNTSELTVLLVDDDKEALEELRDIVELEGWTAIIADSVDMALEVLEWYPFIGVVVTDVHFIDPSGDTSNGIQLVSRAKARFPQRQLNYIVLSGDLTAHVSTEQVGALEFLTKPLDPDALITAIQRGQAPGVDYFDDPDRVENFLEKVQSTTQALHEAHVRATERRS